MFRHCKGFSVTADAWSKKAREFLSVNAFLIPGDEMPQELGLLPWRLTRISLGVAHMMVKVGEDGKATIKTAHDQAAAIKSLLVPLTDEVFSFEQLLGKLYAGTSDNEPAAQNAFKEELKVTTLRFVIITPSSPPSSPLPLPHFRSGALPTVFSLHTRLRSRTAPFWMGSFAF